MGESLVDQLPHPLPNLYQANYHGQRTKIYKDTHSCTYFCLLMLEQDLELRSPNCFVNAVHSNEFFQSLLC